MLWIILAYMLVWLIFVYEVPRRIRVAWRWKRRRRVYCPRQSAVKAGPRQIIYRSQE